jgi:hypothetical protein
MRVNFLSEHLERVTFINCFDAIFKHRRPKIISSQTFMGCRKLGQMTTTIPTVAVIQNRLIFFVSQETMQDTVYSSPIQIITDDKVVLILVSLER